MENGSNAPATKLNYASHGRPGNRIAGARRLMQTRGVSPRPVNTEYYRPVIRDDTAGVLPPLDISTLPRFSPWPTLVASVPLSPQCEPQPSVTVAEISSSDTECVIGASPSVARSPPRASSHQRSTRATRVTPAAATTASAAVEIANALTALGLTAYRCVVFKKTGDELLLATTLYNQRVAIYFARERAVPLRKKGCMFPDVACDIVNEHRILEHDDLDKYGAAELCYTAGAAAAEAEVSAYSSVFGILAAAINPHNVKSSRYFTLLCQADTPETASVGDDQTESSDSTDDCKASSGAVPSPRRASHDSGEIDVHIYAETEAATHEFRTRNRHALFVRAHAVIPIIHFSTVEREISNPSGIQALADCVHAATRSCEIRFARYSFSRVEESILHRLERVRLITARIRELAPECSAARSRETDAALAVLTVKPELRTDKEREARAVQRCAMIDKVCNLGNYGVHLQETIGGYLSSVEAALEEAEVASEIAIARMYTEMRMAIVPRAVSRGTAFARAEKWGYHSGLDNFSVETPPNAAAFLTSPETVSPYVATSMRYLVAAREAGR